MTTTTDEKIRLQAKREDVSLAVAEGRAHERELLEVELELAALEHERALEVDRAAAAQRAADRRGQDQERQAEQERRRALGSKLAGLDRDRARVAHQVDELVDQLRAAVERLVGIAREMYIVTSELGEPRPRLGR
ncbi:MAG: hypothetical protein ACREKS_01315, partial [Candidatus Rokuibacteriota bacterium]